MNGAPLVAFAGGGSGGHIYPGLAVAKALASRTDCRLLWIGSKKPMDRSIVEEAGIEFAAIPAGKLRREPSLSNLVDAFRFLGGIVAAIGLLSRRKPALLFSKGGYASVAPCLAARLLGIPVFTHESDVSPGLATRMNAGSAEIIFTSYDETRAAFPEALRSRVRKVGQPLRRAFREGSPARGRAFLGIDESIPLVLVLGGSQGSRRVNDIVEGALPLLLSSCAVAHQTGAGHPPANLDRVPEGMRGRYRPYPYIRKELFDVMAASSIVAGRAGAGIWEASAAGKALVLAPLEGSGTRGDQVDNALAFERAGAAICLRDAALDAESFAAAVLSLIGDPGRLAAMSAASAALCPEDAAGDIADAIASRLSSLPAGWKPASGT